jgi:hypothetical protein
VKANAIVINTIDKIIRIFMVSLSVPKIIGIGPNIINPPPPTLLAPLSPLRNIIMAAMKDNATPKKIRAKPMENINDASGMIDQPSQKNRGVSIK